MLKSKKFSFLIKMVMVPLCQIIYRVGSDSTMLPQYTETRYMKWFDLCSLLLTNLIKMILKKYLCIQINCKACLIIPYKLMFFKPVCFVFFTWKKSGMRPVWWKCSMELRHSWLTDGITTQVPCSHYLGMSSLHEGGCFYLVYRLHAIHVPLLFISRTQHHRPFTLKCIFRKP